MIGSSVECFRFARRKCGLRTAIVVAWITDRRTFFDDGGVDTEEKTRGRLAAKKRMKKRGFRRKCGDEGRRRRNRVHSSAFFFFTFFSLYKMSVCVWGYLLIMKMKNQ